MKVDINKVKLERARRGLTLEELAKKSKVGISTLSKIELNKSEPRLTTIGKLAEALGKDLEYFLVK